MILPNASMLYKLAAEGEVKTVKELSIGSKRPILVIENGCIVAPAPKKENKSVSDTVAFSGSFRIVRCQSIL